MVDERTQRWEAGARTFYIAEIIRQSSYALSALNDAVRLGRRRPIDPSPWPAVQTFLTSSANVSKTLWPCTHRRTGESREAPAWRRFRGRRLRRELAVDEDWALKDKRVRNSAEHFDER